MGAQNIHEFIPHPKSLINAKDFSDYRELASYINEVKSNPSLQEEFYKWKKFPLSNEFENIITQCKTKHSPLCNICQHISDLKNGQTQHENSPQRNILPQYFHFDGNTVSNLNIGLKSRSFEFHITTNSCLSKSNIIRIFITLIGGLLAFGSG